jgi:spore germination cell wall hydrolase CwlJ-like protein
VLSGVVIVLVVLAALLVWRLRPADPSPNTVTAGTRLQDLPARPEDIEAHGAQAQSVLAPDDARARNAAAPFWTGALNIARPFAFRGSVEDRARAQQCLAAAVLYEAGDDATGQAAVAQVVLNRVRHAAFPGTVCGVVYQGAERQTGCQFTFTCDGSLRRQIPEAAWRRARTVAERALAGWVDDSVGLATHYHTDWVYPYWSPSLRKLARVGTHLFFGGPDGWGGPAAFRREYRGGEVQVGLPVAAASQVALYPGGEDAGPPRILGLPQAPARLPTEMGSVPLYGNRLKLVSPDGQSFGLLAAPGAGASRLVDAARALCARAGGACQVSAWANEDDIPGEFPISAGARSTMVFDYVGGGGGKASLRLDCERYPSKDARLCMAGSRRLPPELSGIRWKDD